MTDIAIIPDEELERDRQESIADIAVCERALAIGYHTHRDGLPVQERLDGNRKIITKIEAEQQRRLTVKDQ
jgi:hypothetical protein